MMKFDVLNIKSLSDADFQKAFESMNKERQERCLRYKFADDRRRMAFGEMLLRRLISEELKVQSESICIENLSSGKPVAKVLGREFFVSISHSGDFVACALSDTPVGIDLEATREIKPDFIKRALSEEEYSFVKESVEGEQRAFLEIWTAKEAYLKLTGEGLSGLKKADVLPLIKGEEKDGLALKVSRTEHFVCTVIYNEKSEQEGF